MTDQDVKIGEVVEASSAGFTAQCYRLGEPPPLGALVVTGDGPVELFAVVSGAGTGGIDPSRKVTAMGHDEASEEGIYAAHPELAQLLRTDFQALAVGYRAGGAVRYVLPPRPARVHAFVREASAEQARDFTRDLAFLRLLVSASAPVGDDAAAAFLRRASQAHPDPRAFLVRAGKALAGLLAQDGQRLAALLGMLRP